MVMTIDWTIIPEYLPIFIKGLQTTLVISIVSIVMGFIGGILIGMCRISRNRLIYGASTVYVEAFRGTPLLIQIFLVYLGLPQLGIYIDSPLVAGLIALSLNSAAYQSEIFRGGVQSISVGQIEAARSLGMTYNQALFNVVIPQAIRNALPPLHERVHNNDQGLLAGHDHRGPRAHAQGKADKRHDRPVHTGSPFRSAALLHIDLQHVPYHEVCGKEVRHSGHDRE